MTKIKIHTPVEQIERMRNLLAFLLVGAFVSMLPALMIFAIPADNKDIITYMVGQLSGMALTALGFYFVNKVGQDALDATRADNTGKMAEAVTTALKTAGTGDGGDAIRPGDAVTIKRAETDTTGLPWDARIHTDEKSTDSDGRWIRRDGIDDETFTAIERSLRETVK
jgi:hypothetical protein